MLKISIPLALIVAALTLPAHAESFAAFLRAFEPKAVAAGVSAAVYQEATAGLTPDPTIPKLVDTQPEVATPMWSYLDQRVTAGRIARGQEAMAANRTLFDAVGKAFGVDPAILGAIWGMETDYGAVLGNAKLIKPIIRSLATLVYEKRGRLAADEADFIAALKLVERGPLDAKHLVGSWAGAIGHLQVNPSNVLAHGTDGDGDGKIDLQDSLADALATSAKFLLDLGYRRGIDWGFEVSVPNGFDYLLADRETVHPIGFFADRGVRRVRGKPFADPSIPVFLYAPAGATGPNFLMTANYLVLKGYNFSDSYALSVAHMADRLKGGKDFAASWPRATKFPDLAQRKAIQAALIKLGLYQGVVDGRLGPVTQAAYAKFQASRGEVADGFITLDAYTELTAALR
ncbi:MAG: lytic murein transglycosylase [Devosia nanyangense]|uniref:Lytic murein transglycosylase n=1 Tax=Devosia nanyangense TaxID=1228055 RepID=A0A933L3Y0_9HYPH|nr:lytic murein transglycosylase [Devosia nanyangense]